MKKRSKIIFVVTGVMAVGGLLILGAEMVAQHKFMSYLQDNGYENAVADKTRLYWDGFVAKNVQLNDNIVLQTLYLQGNPFKLAFSYPDRIWAEKAQVSIDGLLMSDIAWPIPGQTHFEIDNLVLWSTAWDQKLALVGSLKQESDNRALFAMESRADGITVSGQGDIIIQNKKIKTINLDFDDSNLTFGSLDAKRVIAWFVLSRENDGWSINGEANAGSLQAKQLSFLDSSVKFQGSANAPQISFSGLNQKTNNTWVIDGNDAALTLDRQTKTDNFNISVFNKVQFDNWLEQLKDDAPKPLPVIETAAATPAKPVVVPEEKPPAPVPVTPTEINFYDLAVGSLFDGFGYSKKLTRVDVDCEDPAQDGCWSARGIGGSFGYHDTVMPAYLQKLKDYEQAVLLRRVTQSIDIDLLRIEGKGDAINKIIIKGKNGEQPVYLDLAVGDIE